METTERFPAALRDLVVDNDYVTQSGKPNWAAFAGELKGFHYETLRRVVAGEQSPSPMLIEDCARALRIRPECFLEYRIFVAQRDFDPAVVGMERALENLAAWTTLKEGGEHGNARG
jgi:hypothetical protein